MLQVYDNMKNTSNTKQALWLIIGQFSTFAISFISAAILSRYLNKTEYGTYKQILYVYVTLQSLFIMGLPNVFSYFLPRLEIGQQKTFVSLMNRIFLIIGFVLSLTIYLSSNFIADILNNKALSTGLKLFSPFPLFTLPTMGIEGIYTAIKKTKTIAIYQTISRILMLICIICPVVFFKSDYRVAIMGWGIASFLTFIYSIYLKKKPYMNISKEHIENIYKQIFQYSTPLLGAFIFGFIISSADQFFISSYYGTDAFADYSNGCISIPIALMITSSVKNVLLPVISEAEHKGNITASMISYKNAVNKSSILVFPILVFCFFFSQEIMVFLYGIQYETSSIYMKLYIIRDFIAVIPYYSVLMALNMSKTYMYMHIYGVIYIWLLDYIAVTTNLPPYTIVLIRSSFYILSSIYAYIAIYRKSKIKLISLEMVNEFVKILFVCLLVGYITYLINKNIDVKMSLLSLIFSFMLYYILLIIQSKFFIKVNFIEPLYSLVKKK